jgi:hypothetical protein
VSSEDLYGVVWTYQITFGGAKGGYALAVASDGILGAAKPAFSHSLVVYLGPGSQVDDKQRVEAQQIAQELKQNHELEISKESINRIDWLKEGFWKGGHFRFTTTNGVIQIDTVPSSFGRAGVHKTAGQLMDALALLAMDRFYNEKTGVLMETERKNCVAKHNRQR